MGSYEKGACIPHGSLEEQNLYNEYILKGVYQIGLHKRVWVVQQKLTPPVTLGTQRSINPCGQLSQQSQFGTEGLEGS